MNTSRSNEVKAFQTCVIRSELRETQVPKDRILDALRRNNFDEEAVFAVKLALEEALTNAVKHGNQCDPCKCVTVRYAVDDEKAVIAIQDQGAGFAPDTVPDCTSPERLPVPNGRGIMLIRAYMDEVCYADDGREVIFTRRKDSTRSPAEEGVAPSPVRRTIFYSGGVQGVGFRFKAEQIAGTLPVTGFVRNLVDGRVELVAEGIESDLDRLQQSVQEAFAGNIRCVEASASPATGEFAGFSIRH